MIGRREFIALLGGMAATWPLAARAQQPAMPVIGFLGTTSGADWTPLVDAFRHGLRDVDYMEGQNLAIEYRWAEGQFDRLPAMTADLVARAVSVIVTTGSANSTRAAVAATSTIPIVFVIGTDPVKLGLVASFNRPGGNVTGVSWLAAALGTKQLQLLSELLPNASTIGMLVNPANPVTSSELKDAQQAARVLKRDVLGLNVGEQRELEPAFVTLVQQRAGALLVSSDSLFLAQREQIIELARHHAIPAIYPVHEYAAAGGLISYGTRLADAYHQVGVYTGRILRGAKPGELPVQQAAKIELVINLKTAKALGLTVPPSLLAIADEVIE
jgi:putative ABC transport system substrate-binding protein